jgi:deazaflavin-dependent oxidoreductase (nitroreductase family)
MRIALRLFSTAHRFVYRLSAGRIANRVAGLPVLLLTTTGRTTGERRTVPLSFFADGDDYVIIGSKGGSPRHPAWYLNLESDPDVEVQLGADRSPMRARRAGADEAARLWPLILERAPGYGKYRARTSREIPLVFLEHR